MISGGRKWASLAPTAAVNPWGWDERQIRHIGLTAEISTSMAVPTEVSSARDSSLVPGPTWPSNIVRLVQGCRGVRGDNPFVAIANPMQSVPLTMTDHGQNPVVGLLNREVFPTAQLDLAESPPIDNHHIVRFDEFDTARDFWGQFTWNFKGGHCIHMYTSPANQCQAFDGDLGRFFSHNKNAFDPNERVILGRGGYLAYLIQANDSDVIPDGIATTPGGSWQDLYSGILPAGNGFFDGMALRIQREHDPAIGGFNFKVLEDGVDFDFADITIVMTYFDEDFFGEDPEFCPRNEPPPVWPPE